MIKVHVLTWWICAALLSLFVIEQKTIATSLIVILVAVLVSLRWRGNSPWARALSISAIFAAFTILFRMLVAIFIGVGYGPEPLFTLPRVALPSWMAGLVIGGPVSTDRLVAAFTSALALAAVIILVGAAQSLSSPRRILRALPTPFYDFALVIVIATSLVPQFVLSTQRIRRAFEMRGISNPSLIQLATPVVEESLERTLTLAGSMDVRGFGATRKRTTFQREKYGVFDVLVVALCLSFCIAIAVTL